MAAPLCHAELHAKPARATISEIDDLNRAKMDKQETKQAIQLMELEDDSENVQEPTAESPQCGTVSIGNTNNSNNAVSSIVPNNTTVIVNGPVFNTATCGH